MCHFGQVLLLFQPKVRDLHYLRPQWTEPSGWHNDWYLAWSLLEPTTVWLISCMSDLGEEHPGKTNSLLLMGFAAHLCGHLPDLTWNRWSKYP